jgi:hypothetical protein
LEITARLPDEQFDFDDLAAQFSVTGEPLPETPDGHTHRRVVHFTRQFPQPGQGQPPLPPAKP